MLIMLLFCFVLQVLGQGVRVQPRAEEELLNKGTAVVILLVNVM